MLAAYLALEHLPIDHRDAHVALCIGRGGARRCARLRVVRVVVVAAAAVVVVVVVV